MSPLHKVPRHHSLAVPVLASLLIASAVVITACSTAGSPVAANSVSAQPNLNTGGAELAYGASPRSDSTISYQPGVVLVGGGANAVRSVSSDGMVWTIKGDAARATELVPGRIMLASGLGAGRILAVDDQGADKQVVLGPADITDIVRDGDFGSETPISLDAVQTYQTPTRPGLLSDAGSTNAGSTSTGSTDTRSPDADPSGAGSTDAGLPGADSSASPPTVGSAAPSATDPTLPAPSGPESTDNLSTTVNSDHPSTTSDGDSTTPGDSTNSAVPGAVRLPTVTFGARPAGYRAAGGDASGLPSIPEVPPLPSAPSLGALPLPTPTAPTSMVGAYSLTPFCCSGGLGVHLSYRAGGMKVFATLTLHLDQPSVAFRLKIAGGKIVDASVELHGAGGIGIQFSAASEVGVQGNVSQQQVQVPVSFDVPIGGFALPISVRVEQTFKLSTSFSEAGTISAGGDYSFGGTVGFGIHNGTAGIYRPEGFAVKSKLLDSVQATSTGVAGLIFGYQAKLTVGVGLLGFSAGAWVALDVGIGVSAAATEALVHCRGADVNLKVAYGIGYQIPQPVADLVNFFLRAFAARPIKASGGIASKPVPVLDKSDVAPEGSGCQ